MPRGIFKRKPITEETREKMRQARLGTKRPGIGGNKKGFRHTEETKLKMSKNNTRYWLGKKRDDPEYIKKISEAHKGQHSSPATEFKPTGSKGRELLGKTIYRNLHYWVESKLGKPTKCEQCGKDGLTGRQIHWANISGEYKKDVSDWIRLCIRCHFYKDRPHLKLDGQTNTKQNKER